MVALCHLTAGGLCFLLSLVSVTLNNWSFGFALKCSASLLVMIGSMSWTCIQVHSQNEERQTICEGFSNLALWAKEYIDH